MEGFDRRWTKAAFSYCTHHLAHNTRDRSTYSMLAYLTKAAVQWTVDERHVPGCIQLLIDKSINDLTMQSYSQDEHEF